MRAISVKNLKANIGKKKMWAKYEIDVILIKMWARICA